MTTNCIPGRRQHFFAEDYSCWYCYKIKKDVQEAKRLARNKKWKLKHK
jgi:hypothetical protein